MHQIENRNEKDTLQGAFSFFLCVVMLALTGIALIRGDVNGDDELNSTDLVRLIKHIAYCRELS